MYLLILFTLPSLAKATYVITVYGDVYNDTKFFTRTFPWIVDNIGGDISVDYHLLGSGRYSVPQMCALNQLRSNTYLQAEFLKCEAEGTRSEICLCRSGIDPKKFRQCVLERGNMAGLAAFKHSQLNIDVSPIIELGPRITVSEVPDEHYLKKICTIFGDDKPRGCVKPFDCNNNTSTDALESRALAYFDCSKIDNSCQWHTSTTTTPTTTRTTPTTTYTANTYWDTPHHTP
ncbi:uncharacterized protein LOC133524840 [Cydia pomonella]|uniref:uncharacterized protein LOC133524840 n=1 Tax=Cydia pomonella TaxID=82600 RepID=UPI002ADD773B|nr:uncharacterized protein LOC133524840 [Cydia pomonella]